MQGQNSMANPLAELKDVHLPAEVSWWPLAWGWWALACVLIILIGIVLWQFMRKRRFNRARQRALDQVRQVNIRQDDWAYQLNALLKRTAGAYFDQQRVGGLYGKRWLAFLLSHVTNDRVRKQVSDGLDKLQEALYKQGKPAEQDFRICQQACLMWLKHASFRHNQTRSASMEADHV